MTNSERLVIMRAALEKLAYPPDVRLESFEAELLMAEVKEIARDTLERVGYGEATNR